MAPPPISCACGASVPADAAWCPRCHALPSMRPAAPRAAAAVTLTTRREASRFAKTDVSFGLTGRVVMTVLLLIPLAWFVYLSQWMIALGGLFIYAFVLLPKLLRDVWRHPIRR